MGLKTKKKKKVKRILLVAKRGRILSILPLLGILGSLVGKAAGIAKVMNDNKAAQRQLKELKHNRAMEGHGLHLAPYKSGQEVSMKKKKRPKNIKNAKECYHKRTITTNKPYAHSIF